MPPFNPSNVKVGNTKAKNAIGVPKPHFVSLSHGRGSSNLFYRNLPVFRRNQRPAPVVNGVQRNQKLTVLEKMLSLAGNVDSNLVRSASPHLDRHMKCTCTLLWRSGQQHINANSHSVSANSEDFARRVETSATSNCKLLTLLRGKLTDCRL